MAPKRLRASIWGSVWMGVAVLGMTMLSPPLWGGGVHIMQVRPPQVRNVGVDFGSAKASRTTRQVADWILDSDDHQGLPFVIVDKAAARVFVFNAQGQLLGASAALVGLTPGDDGVPGIGDRPLALIRPSERTTPAGRFMASLGENLSGQSILWIDYDQGISLHPVRSVDPSEHRLERLASPSAHDNRISYGCINVPPLFWRDVVQPQFQNTMGLVYVLPDTKPLKTVFKRPSLQPHWP